MQEKQKKPKMDETKKAILFYSGELLIIGLIFGVLGLLMLLGIYQSSDTRRQIFVWITLVGGFLMIGDFFWTLLSKKHRQKSSLLDKIIILPAGISFIVYDIYTLIYGVEAVLHASVVGSVFCYIFVIYAFEAVFHYFHPLPLLLEADVSEKAPTAPVKETLTNDSVPSEKTAPVPSSDDKKERTEL